MSVLGTFKLPTFQSEPFTEYGPGSQERAKLQAALDSLKQKKPEVVRPRVNGKLVETGDIATQTSPFDHKFILAQYHQADDTLVQTAIEGALEAKKKWCCTPLHERAAIFYRAASLIQNEYKYGMMAATMLGQGKNPYQADIDCVSESIDFLKTFPALAEELYKVQPPFNAPNVWNRSEVRPLDGFVYAVSPFNFTALAVNLILAPIIVGNVVIWKPSPSAILSNWLLNEILIEAGLPAGVVQFLPGDAPTVTAAVFNNPNLGSLHFTGSTHVFHDIWAKVASKVNFWKQYPRMVGETSGKNYHLIHHSARVRNAALKTIRAAFEYQGQKCSACSRAYVPRSASSEFLDVLINETKALSMGEKITDFMGPVVNRAAFDRISAYLKAAHADPEVEVLAGGVSDDSKGFYITPTILLTTNPSSRYLKDEIFGPVIAVYVYEDEDFGPDLFQMIDETSPFALTGAIFANDRQAVTDAVEGLRFSAGNFYINDQCTGAMPGHQPFGGSRASGTNDKAGSANLIQRFVSSRTIKESFGGIDSVLYPSNWE